MRRCLLRHIDRLIGIRAGKEPLRGKAMSALVELRDAYLYIEDHQILRYGKMEALPKSLASLPSASVVDLRGRMVLPSWCDSHTHLVYRGSRETEFVDRLRGLSYAEIARRGGGILHSAARVREASEDALFTEAWGRLERLLEMGTGALEIKTGYGLEAAAELKLLRVIHRIRAKAPIPVRVTYLAAHAVPASYAGDADRYIEEVVSDVLPVVGKGALADYVDIFCEEGFFSPAQAKKLLRRAKAWGLGLKLHANQLHCSGGVQVGVELGACSVDHLESIGSEEIDLLSAHSPMCTLLPASAFFLGLPYAPARALIDKGAGVAIASDYNPGSAPTGNMHFVLSLACIGMRMLPEEAIQAATFNGACAMDCQDIVGSIAEGKLANLLVTRPMSSLAGIPYSFADPVLEAVMVGGAWARYALS